MLIDWRVYATGMILSVLVYLSAPLKGWVSRWFDWAFGIGLYGVAVIGALWLIDFIWSR